MNNKMSITDVSILIYQNKGSKTGRSIAEMSQLSGYTEESILYLIESGTYLRERDLDEEIRCGGGLVNDVGEPRRKDDERPDRVSEEYAEVMNLGSYDDDNYYLDDREEGDPEELDFNEY